MKTARHRQRESAICISLFLLAGGCARFEHQTGELEAHAMLLVVDTSDLGGDLGVVKKLDGLPVNAGGEYRLRPGAHVAIVQFVDRFAESYQPRGVSIGSKPDAATSTPPVNLDVSETGKVAVSGQSPVGGGMQMVNVNVANRRIRYVTNSITVEAGWRYELDGDKLRGVRLRAP